MNWKRTLLKYWKKNMWHLNQRIGRILMDQMGNEQCASIPIWKLKSSLNFTSLNSSWPRRPNLVKMYADIFTYFANYVVDWLLLRFKKSCTQWLRVNPSCFVTLLKCFTFRQKLMQCLHSKSCWEKRNQKSKNDDKQDAHLKLRSGIGLSNWFWQCILWGNIYICRRHFE